MKRIEMPKDSQTTLHGLLGTLEGLQDSPNEEIYTNKTYLNSLQSVNSLLSNCVKITSGDTDRVLKMCLQYKIDMRCAPYLLSIISSLIKMNNTSEMEPIVDFLPSAIAVLEFLKQNFAEFKSNHIRTLAFKVLMSHPITALVNLVRSHSPLLIGTFGLCLSFESVGSLEAKSESFNFLQLLELLPDTEKDLLVKEGIPLWLSSVIPTMVKILVLLEDADNCEKCLHYVELLTEQLVLHDYFEYPEWRKFLCSVVDPNKFPMCIKSLLGKGKDTWHRIWIVIIKLLKEYLTKGVSSLGSPINSMLPVVETAFKMYSIQIVRALMCWNELILNFSNETNAICLAKRMKLIMVPLKLYNTKMEDVAAAKFHTWWLLIRKFKQILNQYTKEILIPFLHFLFGKEDNVKRIFLACQFSETMGIKCLEALVEIVGHSDHPERCTSTVDPLNEKLLTIVMLVDHWKDWLYTLKSAVKFVVKNYTSVTKTHIRCIWKSFLLLMTELLDNSVRRDLFNDLIGLLSVLVQDCTTYPELSEILIDDLTLPLFRDIRVNTLISSRSQEHCPMHKIVKLMVDKTCDSYYKRFDNKHLMKMLEPLVSTLVSEGTATPAYMIWLLDELPATDNALILWTSLARAATESSLCLQVINCLLRWPFKSVHTSVDVKDAALAWYKLYNTVHVNLEKIGFDNEISKFLTKPVEESQAANYFILFALIGVMQNKVDEDKMAKLEALTYEMNDYGEFEPLIPALVNTLVLMIDNVSMKTDENEAQITITCVKNILKLINSDSIAESTDTSNRSISNEVTDIPTRNKTVFSDAIMSAMKIYMVKCKNDTIKKEIRKVISSNDQCDDKPVESPKETDVVRKEFVSPQLQNVKRNKKKEPIIVNTVVENGEEYVVVKSNWKFNPKKLTENQIEKFKRKSEIPALYQDLSQSQDEFKFLTWKTNSQDTSLSSSKSSKSASNNDVSEILKNMPSTDIVPTIMENILENAKNTHQKIQDNVTTVPDKTSLAVDKTTPQSPKSSLKTLKDKVLDNENLSSLITTERPARNKKTPKKFDDSLLIVQKKRRQSVNIENEDVEMAVDASKIQTVTAANAIVLSDDVVTNCDFLKDKGNMEPHITEKGLILITPTTPITNETEKSPEKPTNAVDVPSDHASNGFENETARILTEKDNREVLTTNTPLNKIKENIYRKISTRRNSIQVIHRNTHNNDDPLENTLSLRKLRSTSVQKDSSPLTLENKRENQNKNKTSNKIIVNDTDKKELENDSVSTPIIKAKKINMLKSSTKDSNENDENSKLVTLPPLKCKEINQPSSTVEPRSTVAKDSKLQLDDNKNEDKDMSTPLKYLIENMPVKSSVKKSKRSRIEAELMIDMVEGHPFLTDQIGLRVTRNKSKNEENSSKKKSKLEKLNKSKLESTPKTTKKTKEKKSYSRKKSVTVVESESQERSNSPDNDVIDEPPCSEDIIESSQDSTITTISVKSTKKTPIRLPIVFIENLRVETSQTLKDLSNDCEFSTIDIPDQENHERTDIELSHNKTAEMDKNTTDLTENLDTEPMGDNNASDNVHDETKLSHSVINSEPVIGPETQELAEADTQPNDPIKRPDTQYFEVLNYTQPRIQIIPNNTNQPDIEKDTDITLSSSEGTAANIDEAHDVSSPFKDYYLRKQDFLNNTLEISPIKPQSPDREKKSPSPETSSDFVVINLSSPVHSNGEPFDKHGSPEFFTEDKKSPDKRDASPTRPEIIANDTNSSLSLSLKKNRPQVRPSGRAAQMLDLCTNSDLNVTKLSERTEIDNTKKASTSAPGRRILYNSAVDFSEVISESNLVDLNNFLKLNRALPTVTCSPSGPILKRKLIDIADEATTSPASKRKRVSFHDPPVSTTVSVHKYIEPLSLARSPQSSAKKRLEHVSRLDLKSPKRLENAFNLDSVLSKTVESFSETATTEDTQNISLDITPVVEIVKTSDLNDTDPFYPALVDCKDPIYAIATELSSPGMRELLVKELEGKVETIGDLAKMTELEVNRLCIKAPKIKVAKKVLTDYATKQPTIQIVETAIVEDFSEPMTVSLLNESKSARVEMQTDEVDVNSAEIQTIAVPLASAQTKIVPLAHRNVQMNKSSSQTTSDVIATCLVEREDFIPKLCDELDQESIKMIARRLPPELMFDMLEKSSDFSSLLIRRLKLQSKGDPKDKNSIEREDFISKLCDVLDQESIKMIAQRLSPEMMFDVLEKSSDFSPLLIKLLKLQSKGVSKDKSSLGDKFLRVPLSEECEIKDIVLLCTQLLQTVQHKLA